MMQSTFLFNITKNKRISDHVEIALTFAQRSKGLLGRKGLEQNQSLWIHHCNSVHTFFMQFSIDVLYVNKDLQVTKIHRDLQPWRLSWGGFESHSCFEFQAHQLTHEIKIGDYLRVSA